MKRVTVVFSDEFLEHLRKIQGELTKRLGEGVTLSFVVRLLMYAGLLAPRYIKDENFYNELTDLAFVEEFVTALEEGEKDFVEEISKSLKEKKKS